MSATLTVLLSKALKLFLVLDPIGNTGIIATLISGFSKERQIKILVRELLFALMTLMVVFFLGTYLLDALGISQAAISITGGVIFAFFAVSLLFPGTGVINLKKLEEEPFFVPISLPLIVGPSSIATVILFAHDHNMWLWSLLAILLAWVLTSAIILLGPILLVRTGKTGMHVTERMIGMLCALIAVKMIVTGIDLFIATLN